MADAEGKSGAGEGGSNWPEEVVDSVQRDETPNVTTEAKTGTKSSWGGWLQRMNDTILGAPEKDESTEIVDAAITTSAEEEEDERNESSWGAWGSAFLKQAKEKTRTTFDLVKKDLTEFSDVVQNETANIVSATSTTIRDRAPKFVDSIVGTVNTVLLVEDTTRGEEDSEVPITAADVTTVCGNRSQARLYAIQSDPGTYCNEPDGAPELFDDWLDHSFNLEDKKEDISHLLVTNPTVRNMFAKLVPSHVSNTMFWQRYFYKLHQFELDEARRQALLKREAVASLRDSEGNPHLSWGDESDPDDHRHCADNVDTESFCDLSKEAIVDAVSEKGSLPVSSGNRKQSPACSQDQPERVSAILKAAKDNDCSNVEVQAVDSQQEEKTAQVQQLDIASSVNSSSGHDTDGGSPTDKKSDDWVEWEGNENNN